MGSIPIPRTTECSAGASEKAQMPALGLAYGLGIRAEAVATTDQRSICLACQPTQNSKRACLSMCGRLVVSALAS